METLTQEEQDLLDKAIEENDYKHIIPVNSKTLTMSFAQSRFTAAEWYEKAKEQTVILAGCGGIGSYTGFLLARLGIRSIVLYDNDVVGEENLSGQLFGINEIGRNKAVALAAFIVEYADMTNTTVTSMSTTYHSESNVADIMICGFDNMAARNLFFHKWKERVNVSPNKSTCLYIDGRLAAEEFQIFCIKGDDDKAQKIYEEEWLFEDSQAEATICSYKQTTFCANMIASYMINCFVNFLSNQNERIIDRSVPFMIYFDAKQMIFKTTETWQL